MNPLIHKFLLAVLPYSGMQFLQIAQENLMQYSFSFRQYIYWNKRELFSFKKTICRQEPL